MSISQSEDLKWLSRIRNGDEAAFDRLFIKYYPGLLRFSKSLLHAAHEETEDVVQDVFLKLWQQRATLAVHTAVAPFLYTSVKNRVHDYYRKKQLPLYDPLDTMEEPVTQSYLAPDQLLMFKQLNVDIDQMIARLPERTQLVFRMNREDQLSYEDIARLLGISVNSVKTHMYRAIKFLKEIYRHYDFPS